MRRIRETGCITVDFSDFFGEYGGHKTGEVASVNKNSMKIRFYIMSFTTGPTQIDFDYVYTDGTLKPKSTIGTHHSMYLLVNGTNMYIEVSYYGKKGWINAQKGYQGESGKLFSNVMYAG